VRVTCRFLRDALNTGSYLELHRRRFARIPETRRLFMYSKLTEYINNYGVPKRREGSETRTKEEARERERKRGELDLIDKVDLSATRGRIYVRLASFFRRRPLTAILGPREPFVFSTTRHYPRRKRPSCTTCFRLRVPSLFFPRFRIISSFDFFFFPIQRRWNVDRIFIALLMTSNRSVQHN